LVQADPAIRDLISHNCEDARLKVQCASSAEQALDRVGASQPDLVLLDWTLPDMSGIELTQRLRANQRTRHLPIIMLSARSGEQDKIAGLDSGADDFVTMPFSRRELFARINAVLRQQAPQTSDQSVLAGGLKLEPITRRVSATGKSLALAPTEFSLLHFLMKRPGRVLTRAQIVASVWGDNAIAGERTVDVSIRRLRKKLEEFDREYMIETVRGEGYRFSIPNCMEQSTRMRLPAAQALI
jgi:two-component system phosphate regulon response regulator PhoB